MKSVYCAVRTGSLNKAVCCIYLRTNSDLCHLYHKLIGFYNRDEKYLLRGMNWVFKYSNLHFVFKGLICWRIFYFTNDPQNRICTLCGICIAIILHVLHILYVYDLCHIILPFWLLLDLWNVCAYICPSDFAVCYSETVTSHCHKSVMIVNSFFAQ